MRIAIAIAVLVIGLTGCASGPDLQGPIYKGVVMVRETGTQKPALCDSTPNFNVAQITPLPPGAVDPDDPSTWSCTTVPLRGWTWDGVPGVQRKGDVTWGTFWIEGTYDGTFFTATRATTAPRFDPDAEERDDVPPAGKCGGSWAANCPGDLASVSLPAISEDLAAHGEALGLGVSIREISSGSPTGHVDLHFLLMYPDAQEKLDERYGPGMVRLLADLVPSQW